MTVPHRPSSSQSRDGLTIGPGDGSVRVQGGM